MHQTSANKTAVMGILYEIGDIKDPLLLWLEPSIRSIENTKDQPKDIGVVDPQRCARHRQRVLPLHGLAHHAALHRGGRLDRRQQGTYAPALVCSTGRGGVGEGS